MSDKSIDIEIGEPLTDDEMKEDSKLFADLCNLLTDEFSDLMPGNKPLHVVKLYRELLTELRETRKIILPQTNK